MEVLLDQAERAVDWKGVRVERKGVKRMKEIRE